LPEIPYFKCAPRTNNPSWEWLYCRQYGTYALPLTVLGVAIY